MNPILECSGLSKQYTSGCYALNNLNLSLERGQIIGLLGPNGSGKTTFIKLINDLLTPTSGQILIDGKLPGVDTKAMISYLPERTHLDQTMKIKDLIKYFADFYEDFRAERAFTMLKDLNIDQNARLKNLSKGTKEKVQLILVMSRDAKLYILDEPIGGVDPAARDYILHTILNNYNEEATILLSTHLIHDIESILDQVIFIRQGQLVLNASVDEIRMEQGKSVDSLFREVFNVKKTLIKYDFKALNRYLLLIHAFLLAAAAAVRIFLDRTFAHWRLTERYRVNIWNYPVRIDCRRNLLCHKPVDRNSFL